MKHLWAFAPFPFLLIPAAAQNCDQLMKDFKPDTESVRRAAREWSKVFLTGDTDYLECLLEPDYESVWYAEREPKIVRRASRVLNANATHHTRQLTSVQVKVSLGTEGMEFAP